MTPPPPLNHSLAKMNASKQQGLTYMSARTHTWPHAHTADEFLPQEVSDLHQRASLLNHHVNREMGIYRSHLVSETLEKNKLINSQSK